MCACVCACACACDALERVSLPIVLLCVHVTHVMSCTLLLYAFIEHDLKSLMETMQQPFLAGVRACDALERVSLPIVLLCVHVTHVTSCTLLLYACVQSCTRHV